MSRPSEPSRPRHAAHGIGILFQSAGLIFAFGGCCVCSFFGLIQTPNRLAAATSAATVFDAWRAFAVHERLAAVSVFAHVVAGLALLAAGIGLQHDRRGSALLATLAALPMALFHAAYVLHLIVRGPRDAWMLGPAALLLIWSALALLALVARNEHRRFPPPPGPEILPPGFQLPRTAGERMRDELQSRP